MAVLIISIILFVLTLAGVTFGYLYYKKEVTEDLYREVDHMDRYNKGLNDNQEQKIEKVEKLAKIAKRKVRKFLLAYLVLPLAFFPLIFGIFTSIGANQVGIVFDQLNGGIQDETLGQGVKVKSIFQKITKIGTANQIRYVSVYGQSKDGNSVEFEVTLTIFIAQEDAGKFYRKMNAPEIGESHLNTLVKEAIQKVSSKYEVFDIVGSKLETVRKEIEDEVKELLYNEYFITLAALSVEDVDVGPDIEKALERKAEEKLKLEIAEAERIRTEIEAQTEIIKAENEATIILLKAEANAEAQSILNSVAVNAIQKMYISQFETEADKEEFELNGVGGYLTIQEVGDIVIKQLYYDIWDGKLPSVITDGSGIIIQP